MYNYFSIGVMDIKWSKKLAIIMIIVFMFSFSACGDKEKDIIEKDVSKVIKGIDQGENSINVNLGDSGDNLPLPENFPKDILPLSKDANIINVRKNPQNDGLGISYVSGESPETLLELYKVALKDEEKFEETKTDAGYVLTARKGSIYFNIMINEGFFENNPKYKGKLSVNIELIGIKSNDSVAEPLVEHGKLWPTSDMSGVPELKGSINSVNYEDNIVRLEVYVDGVERVKNYITEVEKCGFSFDSEPDTEGGNIQFYAFKDNSVLNFAYKGSEKLVFIEYSK